MLTKPLSEINLDELYALPHRSSYSNIPAMLRDTNDKLDKITLSKPFTVTGKDVVTTSQFEYGANSWREELDANGNPVLRPDLNTDKIKALFAETGDPATVFDYFSRLYDASKPIDPKTGKEIPKVKKEEGAPYEKAVYELAQAFMQDRNAYQTKFLKQTAKPRPVTNRAASAKANLEKERKDKIEKMAKILREGKPQDVLNFIKQKGVKDVRFAKWKSGVNKPGQPKTRGYYKHEDTGEVLSGDELRRRGLSRPTKKINGVQAYAPIDSKWTSFTGIAIDFVDKEGNPSTVTLDYDFGEEESFMNAATKIYDDFMKKETPALTPPEDEEEIDYTNIVDLDQL
jgi:hypothetical protein